MAQIRYRIESDCDSEEPSRLVLAIHGEILEFQEDSSPERKIGQIFALLVQRGRAMDEQESLNEVMDSVDAQLCACYHAVFQPSTDDWSDGVTQMYKEGFPGLDVLLIEGLEIDAGYQGKQVATKVVRETIAAFGGTCGLIVCNPLDLQYEDEDLNARQDSTVPQHPDLEGKHLFGFARFVKFWSGFGFRKLPGSEFYTFAPQLLRQPDSASPEFVTSAPERTGTWVH